MIERYHASCKYHEITSPMCDDCWSRASKKFSDGSFGHYHNWVSRRRPRKKVERRSTSGNTTKCGAKPKLPKR
jgi:hypothetical protein